MKLLDIIQELQKPEQIYNPEYEDSEEDIDDISKLSPAQRKELFKKGVLIIGDNVFYSPKLDKMKKNIIASKKEFQVFKYYPDDNIREMAKEITNLHNELFSKIRALDTVIELKKSNKL